MRATVNFRTINAAGVLTAANLATAFSVPVPLAANCVLMTVISGVVRYTLDGSAPVADTATNSRGFRLMDETASIEPTLIYVEPGTTMRFIRAAASTDATVIYQFGEILT